ncbi:malonyl-[acyl-carrier protein] O-methyltransferase BioC [Photobacterium proteolyticum]|uniref:Malonyl-[acyl-carrier protein] O-methyltransferase n=1 Tax=Photobacterium proteolyticum TaxID=1903952 RepID=A0A1Q9GFY0_9GAMM|nr:malonyl-ACP O-methyltransferase BioC [Photobacterium proteolyticum]OLQ73334.1 malonyl-[acyl-carrier protein] O-methyltransferase BioC [Photobacterium proteolyticum]
MTNGMNAVTHGQHEIQPQDKKAIAEAFGRAAKHYDKAAAFQRQVGHLLLDKLPAVSQVGSRALDLGCGTGYFSDQLLQRGYRVSAADLSVQMLAHAKKRCGDMVTYIEADAENLPLEENQFDIAFSSLALQWCDDLSVPLAELKRVVKPGGLILFSTLADGSLYELAKSWQQVDQYQHVNEFLSPKAIKLALAQAGCSSDGLEFTPITMQYNTAVELMKDLKGIGATHLQQERKAGLAGRKTIQALENAYAEFRDENGQLPATYQVCFGVIIND